MISLPTKKITIFDIFMFTAYSILFAAVFVKRKLQNSHICIVLGNRKKDPQLLTNF